MTLSRVTTYFATGTKLARISLRRSERRWMLPQHSRDSLCFYDTGCYLIILVIIRVLEEEAGETQKPQTLVVH
jgi:hypothetical protein